MEIIKKSVSYNGFEAALTGYVIHNDAVFRADRVRPAILILPGGGYEYTSCREAEPIALRFSGMGFQTFVLEYSCSPTGAVYPVALEQAKAAMKLIRANASEWCVDAMKVAVMGFSAGGHLAANLACDSEGEEWPSACVLGYPVITADARYTHRGSIEKVSGKSFEEADKDFFSMEKHVTKNNPPTFLWHTWEDGCVNVMNTLLFATALKEAGVTAEVHIFPYGGHGLALASEETSHENGCEIVEECQQWPELAGRFLRQVM